jgi:hypothetical protein
VLLPAAVLTLLLPAAVLTLLCSMQDEDALMYEFAQKLLCALQFRPHTSGRMSASTKLWLK